MTYISCRPTPYKPCDFCRMVANRLAVSRTPSRPSTTCTMNATELPTLPAPVVAGGKQPQAMSQMSVTSPAPAKQQQQCEHTRASRLRGGGAGRDCFLGLIECFLCFECCKDCCECAADIICCPCEMIGL